jgi:signal transduction histidine kinase
LELSHIRFSPGAKDQLSNYLWFGNLSEMETVIARTLAVRRKTTIEAEDLVFDFSDPIAHQELPEFEEFTSSETSKPKTVNLVPSRSPTGQTPAEVSLSDWSQRAIDLKVLIHELAHEMKNPMVTIKTFAQLLGDRYQDEDFRARFRDVVGSDIERMDDLLEMMIEFADFNQPRVNRVSLEERLRLAIDEVGGECGKRQASVVWQTNGFKSPILADEDQLDYVLKNVLLAIVSQAKIGSEIDISIRQDGRVDIAYVREGPRMASITQYLGSLTEAAGESILPLRILLAKQLVERNRGKIAVDSTDPAREILTLEFPIA